MVQANYFDGRSTRIRPVELSTQDEDLIVSGEDVERRVSFATIAVDERLGRAARRLRFDDGAFCEVRDLEALDLLLAAVRHRDGWVDRMQRRARFVLVFLVAGVLIAIAAYQWGLPWAAAAGARHLPPAIGRALSVQTLQVLDQGFFSVSKVPPERQRSLSAKFHSLRLPEGDAPRSALVFRASSQLGANALTLPDGTIIVTDGLIKSIDNDQQILAVFSHELGHAHGRHGLRLLLESTAIGAFLTFYLGDVSSLLAAAPAAIVQARYSRDLERQADDYGAALLIRNGMSPVLLADALKTLVATHPASGSSYLASHPATTERMRHLLELAGQSVPPAP